MHWITYQLTYKLVPEDQLCYSTFPTASNHIHFKDKKSCKGNSTANLQVISPAGRMKNWVQFTLSQMPQHCSADSGKNTIVSEKQMPRTTLTPELLVAWCHVYIYNPGRECKTVWIQIIEEIGVKAGFTRQKKNKNPEPLTCGQKKFQVLLCKGSVLSQKCPEVHRKVAKECWPTDVLNMHVQSVVLDGRTPAKLQPWTTAVSTVSQQLSCWAQRNRLSSALVAIVQAIV